MGKCSDIFAVETNANEMLHRGGHYKLVGNSIIEGVKHELDRVAINRFGAGCERAAIEWQRCRLKCFVLRLHACV